MLQEGWVSHGASLARQNYCSEWETPFRPPWKTLQRFWMSETVNRKIKTREFHWHDVRTYIVSNNYLLTLITNTVYMNEPDHRCGKGGMCFPSDLCTIGIPIRMGWYPGMKVTISLSEKSYGGLKNNILLCDASIRLFPTDGQIRSGRLLHPCGGGIVQSIRERSDSRCEICTLMGRNGTIPHQKSG